MIESVADGRIETAAFILSLREKGVSDVAVLRAMERVPREIFAPRRFVDLARADVALPLPSGQTMTSPTVIAQMLMLLAVSSGHRVLEIGTGSGWVTALLAHLGGSVCSVERRPLLRASAEEKLRTTGFGDAVEIVEGDGFADDRSGELYDRVILNGALPRIPDRIASRLAAGGRLVGALSGEREPRLVLVRRGEDGRLIEEIGSKVRLAPLAGSPAAPIAGRTSGSSTEV